MPLSSSELSSLLRGVLAGAPAALLVVAACGGETGTSGGDGSSGGSSSGTSTTSSGGDGDVSSGGATASGSDCQPISPTNETVPLPDGFRLCADGGDGADGGGAGDAGDEDAGCLELPRDCETVCPTDPSSGFTTYAESCRIVQTDGGDSALECDYPGHPCGRRHDGLAPAGIDARDGVGRWLAEAAYLEDASILSFEILARELEAHGAPAPLVRAAERSARDEVRHARVMRALARRHGAEPPRAKTPARPPRSLAAMLLENAVEGCVGETYGALLAHHQREHAADPRVRAAMARIAEDETRHAALAWQIAAWAEPSLDDDARARLSAARAEARAKLSATLASSPAPEVARALGIPSADRAVAMLAALTERLDRAAA